jgi:hypothetical protein
VITSTYHPTPCLCSGRKNIATGKYSSFTPSSVPHLSDLAVGADPNLIAAAYSESSWKRISAALNSYKRFATDSGTVISWPFTGKNVCNYITWAQKIAKLSPNTVSVYLSDLATGHRLRGLDPSACSCFLAKTMLKGAKNLASYTATTKEPKAVMTLSCLKILGHEIATSDWSVMEKSVFWAACTLAFFGSFRISEILCPAHDSFNEDTLVWSDVVFNDKKSVTVHVRHPKSNRIGGEKVEVFEFNGHNCCPVRALCNLKSMQCNLVSRPVFAFSDSEYLSKGYFNATVSKLLCKHIPNRRILRHSFRAGIPSALSANPDKVTPEEIQAWGRWSSNSYRAYTKLTHHGRRQIFEKFLTFCTQKPRE